MTTEEITEKLNGWANLTNDERENLKQVAKAMGINTDDTTVTEKEKADAVKAKMPSNQPFINRDGWMPKFDAELAEKSETAFANNLPDRPKRAI